MYRKPSVLWSNRSAIDCSVMGREELERVQAVQAVAVWTSQQQERRRSRAVEGRRRDGV